jgi:N-acetylneuraminic acid mutarotase
VVGGGDNNFPTDSDSLSSVELYDPRTNGWTPGVEALAGTSFATATLLADGSVLLVGGLQARSFASILDPAGRSWSALPSNAQVRYWHTATTLRDGSILVAGGRTSSFNGVDYTYGAAEVGERFDPASQSWSDAGKHVEPRFSHTATLLRDGRVLVVGGLVDVSPSRSRFVQTAELYSSDVAPCEKNHYILCRRRLTVPTGP